VVRDLCSRPRRRKRMLLSRVKPPRAKARPLRPRRPKGKNPPRTQVRQIRSLANNAAPPDGETPYGGLAKNLLKPPAAWRMIRHAAFFVMSGVLRTARIGHPENIPLQCPSPRGR